MRKKGGPGDDTSGLVARELYLNDASRDFGPEFAFRLSTPGAHQMDSPSPIHAIGVNPFPNRFINRTVP